VPLGAIDAPVVPGRARELVAAGASVAEVEREVAASD
jgi:hypothetical protein